MGDKLLVFIGTYGVIMFNLLVILFAFVLFNDVSFGLALAFTIIFGGSALFFDWKLAKYFFGILKIKRQNRKKDEKV